MLEPGSFLGPMALVLIRPLYSQTLKCQGGWSSAFKGNRLAYGRLFNGATKLIAKGERGRKVVCVDDSDMGTAQRSVDGPWSEYVEVVGPTCAALNSTTP
jgi:hypothetical protein